MSIAAIALIWFYVCVTGPVVLDDGKAPQRIECSQENGTTVCVEKNSQIAVDVR